MDTTKTAGKKKTLDIARELEEKGQCPSIYK